MSPTKTTDTLKSSKFPPGVYCPTITFYTNDSNQDIDLEAQREHTRFLLRSGVQGIVVHGTTGEAVLLSTDERNLITETIAAVRTELNSENVPIVVGCTAQATRDVLAMCKDAKKFGGDYVLVLPSAYWSKATTVEVIEKFFLELAEESPLPIIIYSFPMMTANIDLSSDLLTRLGRHPNIAGVKLTCGNLGKLTRLTSIFDPSEFFVLGGSAEWLLPGLLCKSSGAITGLANTHPRSCVKLYELYTENRLKEAVELQGPVSFAEWAMANTGMAGTKYCVQWVRGFKERLLPRRPLVETTEETKAWIRENMKQLNVIEKELAIEQQK